MLDRFEEDLQEEWHIPLAISPNTKNRQSELCSSIMTRMNISLTQTPNFQAVEELEQSHASKPNIDEKVNLDLISKVNALKNLRLQVAISNRKMLLIFSDNPPLKFSLSAFFFFCRLFCRSSIIQRSTEAMNSALRSMIR